jgi:drug/metabolite transporter (DMT)-like permease
VDALGVLIALGCPIGYAGFTLLSYRWRMAFVPEAITAWGLPVAAVPVLLLAGPARAAQNVASWTPTVWAVVILMAVFPTIAAIGLYVRGMARLGAPAAAVASTFEPVVTLVLAAVVLGERLTSSQWIGVALVLVGVMVAEGLPALVSPRHP